MNGPVDNLHLIVTLLTLAGAVVLLVGNFLRNDMLAVLVLLTLALTGVLDISEAFSGFSNPAVIIIACMFVVGEAILNTGVARRAGEIIIRYGGASETRVMLMTMATATLVGSAMSSTATAAIFIPITLAVAETAGLNHKRLLMPLAAASLISGMMTLVATTPNIILNEALRERGHATLSFFSFTPFGVVSLGLAALFMVFFGRNMLAKKRAPAQRKREPSIDDLLRYYQIDKNEYLLRVPEHSELVNSSLAMAQLNAQHHVILLAVRTVDKGAKTRIVAAQPEMVFRPGDLLLIIGTPEHVTAFAERFSLDAVGDLTLQARRRAFFQVVGIAELMLNPDSTLIGKSLRETHFQASFHGMVLGIRRKGVTLTHNLTDTPLKFGDVLLVCGPWQDLIRLSKTREHYVLLTLPHDYKEVIPAKNKELLALAILGAMVALMVFNLLPPVTAVLAATCALLLTRCVPLSSVYKIIDWQTVIMIAGILPLALAMRKTGIISHVSEGFLLLFQQAGPLVSLAGLFLITAALGLFMTNTATAVLIAPMAVDVALRLNISPQACAMVVAIACSAAFVSPLGSPVTMLVREPGGYGLKDFAKTGVPLLFLCLLATVGLAWLFYL